MQTLSPNCNLIFCSAGQRDQHLSLCRPRPPHHSYVYNCHRDVACQQDSSVLCSLSPHSHSGNKPVISSCFHDGWITHNCFCTVIDFCLNRDLCLFSMQASGSQVSLLGGGSSLWRDQSQGRKQLCALGIWKAFMLSTPFPASCWIAAALHSASILNAFSIDSDITDSCFKVTKAERWLIFTTL